jgi:hypothetical protein
MHLHQCGGRVRPCILVSFTVIPEDMGRQSMPADRARFAKIVVIDGTLAHGPSAIRRQDANRRAYHPNRQSTAVSACKGSITQRRF